jgi:glucokinase
MYLGIEIGGTKLQLGLGPGDGTLAALWRSTVDVKAAGEGIRAQILAAVPELLGKAGLRREQVRGVGIGFGGPVDDATRTVIKSHQIEGWDAFPLATWITDMLGWPAVLGNDADVAGLAEALFGAGKGLSPIFYITLGSGIGGGFIINGEIYRGCGRGAAEIGHLRVAADSWSEAPTFLKVRNIESIRRRSMSPLEQLASGWAIGELARARLPLAANRDSLLAQLPPDTITAVEVVNAARQGDAFASAVLEDCWSWLAEAICQVITLLCPRRIIIGGGVSLAGELLLFEPLRDLVRQGVFQPFADCYDIVPAALGEEVVVHGALALAARHFAR